jgi:hypothetical protein
VTAEEIVFLAAGAVCALQTANQEDGHAYSDGDGDCVSVGAKPMYKKLHTRRDHGNILQNFDPSQSYRQFMQA